ncbi:MAG: hypothetical protein O7G85_06520 [Planctomycetota bacterium]|nr:hypothetical protein [Planctomycetota bacterium]
MGTAATIVVLASSGLSQAAEVDITVMGSSGPFSATANFNFDDSGGSTILSIQLTNTGGTDEAGNAWLTGLFFDVVGSPDMTYVGLGGDGSDSFNDLVYNDLSTYTPVAGEDAAHFWGLNDEAQTNLASTGSQEYALYAAGFFGLPTGNTDMLDYVAGGPDPQPDGPDGGIINTATTTGGPEPKILNGIWLVFDLGQYAFDESSVSNVWFQYGTDNDQPGFGKLIPVPLALPLGLAGLAGIAVGRKRLRRALA